VELGLVGLCPPRHGLGIPLAFAGAPPGGADPFGYSNRSLVCFVSARRPGSTRIACIVVVPTDPRIAPRIYRVNLALRSPAQRDDRLVVRRLVRVSKDRPFTVLRDEESSPTCTSPCRLRGSVTNRARVPPSWFSTTVTACSSSALPGSCTGVPVLGFVTFRAARRRLPRHEVLPFEALLPARSRHPGWRTIRAPGRRHPRGRPLGSPPALPPRPCCLGLEALLCVQSRVPRGVATNASSLLPWACPACCGATLADPRPASARAAPTSRTGSRRLDSTVPDERQRSPRGAARVVSDVLRWRAPSSEHRSRRDCRGGSPQPLPPHGHSARRR
jgi:hypothetical protein